MRLILASSSPRRRELVTSLGIPFDIIKPDIDESEHPDESHLHYVARLAQEKAQAVTAQLNPADSATGVTVLAADTIVVLAADTIGIDRDGLLLGKPLDADDARRMLTSLRNRPHRVCTAITLLDTTSGTSISDLITTTVHMRGYSDAEIDAYIATGDPFDKAGSYAIQHQDFRPVARIDGCYNNVVGLPLCAVKRALVWLGWPNISAAPTCDCPPFNLS